MNNYTELALKVDELFDDKPNLRESNYFKPLFMHYFIKGYSSEFITSYAAQIESSIVILSIKRGALDVRSLDFPSLMNYLRDSIDSQLRPCEKQPDCLVIHSVNNQYALGLLLDDGRIYNGFINNPYVAEADVNVRGYFLGREMI